MPSREAIPASWRRGRPTSSVAFVLRRLLLFVAWPYFYGVTRNRKTSSLKDAPRKRGYRRWALGAAKFPSRTYTASWRWLAEDKDKAGTLVVPHRCGKLPSFFCAGV
jgi:hypothetical protein